MKPSPTSKTAYVCQNCGAVSNKWRGKCDGCNQWDTIAQEAVLPPSPSNVGPGSPAAFESLAQQKEETYPRLHSGMGELDRVFGGGIVPGSVCLVAGDPGIGKSTLLLQLAGLLSTRTPTIYVSGEESAAQIRLRAGRLGLANAPVNLISTQALDSVFPLLANVLQPDAGMPGFMIIDSIQTMMIKEAGGTPGTLAQVRECMSQLITLAKSTGMAVMIVGHITKEGAIAGPKLLEHMVDTVLYFEGENNRPYRLLRTIKNRFGATHEVGVFDMTASGLREVPNPSSLFLSTRQTEIPGACIFAGMEGTRPLLVEVQALSTQSFLPAPRRSVVGWDHGRLSMVLAVLEARCQMLFAQKDVFLTVLGGLRVQEPAADLCVAMALLSCLSQKPLPARSIAFGEIGLTGEVYCASFTEHRLREASQLGFEHVFMPGSLPKDSKLNHTPITHVRDLAALFGPMRRRQKSNDQAQQ
jgi:DNA repair protein RadA/Sms